MAGNNEEWTEKYRPKKLIEVLGNNKAAGELNEWAESINKAKSKKAAILHGPPGCGKTSAAYALAAEKGWDVIELNASDQRSEKVIKSIVGPASTSNTFSRTTRLIILDEADNLHGNEDRGGTKAITEIIKKSTQPILLIANELYKMGTPLQRNCKLIRFQKIRAERIVRVLKRLSAAEGISVEDEALRNLAENANGDLRSAINDLQAISISDTGKGIVKDDIATGKRDVEVSIFEVLKKILGGSGYGRGYEMQEVLFSLYNLDKTPDETINWIYANLPNAYGEGEEKKFLRGLHYLCRADLFLGRTRRRENYKFWRYASSLMACGVFSTKVGKESGQPRRQYYQYKSPWQRARPEDGEERKYAAVKEELAKKVGAYCKVPLHYARSFIIPLLKVSFRNESKARDIAASLRLDVPQIAFLTSDTEPDTKERNKKAKRIYQDAVAITAGKNKPVRSAKVKAAPVPHKKRVAEEVVELKVVKAPETVEVKKKEEKEEEETQKTFEDFF
ncbi:replication factor C large subunit [Candidatus Methanophagaceae archaeon]|nr:replication factor C large subunit [Methanophagales archaeon]